MKVERIDHLVLTVMDIETSSNFYCSVMGMQKVIFGEGRVALKFGNQKINLHQVGNEFDPKAQSIQNGSSDLCFVITTPIEDVVDELTEKDIEIIEGPVQRTGAIGNISSVYFRDPDGNLIEVSNYASV